MEKYISKSALVAEIERRINEINLDTIEDWRYRLQWEHDIEVMKNILSFIDTLEVKEVDFDDKDKWKNTGGFGSTWDPDSPDYCPD